MAKRTRLPDGDDGHTIVPMNIPGMPGYTEERPENRQSSGMPETTPTKEETRWWIMGSLRAALAIWAALAVGVVAFVLLLLFIWR